MRGKVAKTLRRIAQTLASAPSVPEKGAGTVRYRRGSARRLYRDLKRAYNQSRVL